MEGSESFHAHSGGPTNTRFVVAQPTCNIVSTTGTLTQSALHTSLRYHLLITSLSPTVTMQGDGSIERPDEFVTDNLESDLDVPCQFRTYYILVVFIIHLQ